MERMILIGASTGGPGLIEKIIMSLPFEFRFPIIIAQHMDSIALNSFARRIGRLKGHSVRLVDQCTKIEEGRIYILADTCCFVESNDSIVIEPSREKGFFHPTIDTLFNSAASLKNVEIIAILLSGIGSDGAKGMKKLKHSGHLTIAQDEETSVVYGMPKRAKEIDGTQEILAIDSIVERVSKKAL